MQFISGILTTGLQAYLVERGDTLERRARNAAEERAFVLAQTNQKNQSRLITAAVVAVAAIGGIYVLKKAA